MPKVALVLLAIAAAVGVAVLLILVLGGDDEGGGGGTFAGEITDDDQVDVQRIHLDTGEAVRASVEPDSDLDAIVGIGIDAGDAGDGFLSLFPPGNEDFDTDAPQANFGGPNDRFFDVFSDSDLSEAFTEDDFSDVESDLIAEAPAAEDAGIVFDVRDPGFEGDDEFTVFAAPVEADYTILVTAYGDTEGEYELIIEDAGRPEDFDEDQFDPEDEIDDEDYGQLFFAHQEFFCDDEFFGDDFLSDGSFLCEADDFDEYYSDFSDFGTDFTEFTDFTDFTDDFTDDFTEPPSECEQAIEGEPIEVGATINSSIVGPDDFLAFELVGDGQPFNIAVDQADQQFDPIVTVCDSTGFEVARDDDGGGFPNSLLADIETVTGDVYIIVVTGFSGSTGDFEMRVRP